LERRKTQSPTDFDEWLKISCISISTSVAAK
jgi:hypothetical protein